MGIAESASDIVQLEGHTVALENHCTADHHWVEDTDFVAAADILGHMNLEGEYCKIVGEHYLSRAARSLHTVAVGRDLVEDRIDLVAQSLDADMAEQ